MRATINGPYPRVGSELGDKLRKAIGKKERPLVIQKLKEDLTTEIVRELLAAGIDLPNYGFIDVNDELSWPLEDVEGITFGGMKKTFHTNIHHKEICALTWHKEIIVTGKLHDKPLINELYSLAVTKSPQGTKLELPGPYTLACHTVIGAKSPYRTIEELAHAYADFYRTTLCSERTAPLIQFNEPSITAHAREHPHLEMLPELYGKLLDCINLPTAIWTYYGSCDEKTLDILLATPVDVIGLDFVWDPTVAERIKKKQTTKGIGFGIIDSGDTQWIGQDDEEAIITTIKDIGNYVDLQRCLITPNATLEHLPRDYAQQRIKLAGQIKDKVGA